MYCAKDLSSVEIPDDIFKDKDNDYGANHEDFDTVMWLPSTEIIKQIPNHMSITGVVLCLPSLHFAHDTLDTYLSNIGNDFYTSQKKRLSNENKMLAVEAIKSLIGDGFMFSVSIPAYLFDHDDKHEKVKFTNFALTNSMLQKVFEAKRNAQIRNINIHLFSKGKLNRSIDNRIKKLGENILTSTSTLKKNYLKLDQCVKNRTLERLLELSCWFVSQETDRSESKWLNDIKN